MRDLADRCFLCRSRCAEKLEAVIRRELRNRTARAYTISLMCDINDRVRVEFTPIAHARPFSNRSRTILQEVIAVLQRRCPERRPRDPKESGSGARLPIAS